MKILVVNFQVYPRLLHFDLVLICVAIMLIQNSTHLESTVFKAGQVFGNCAIRY